MSSGTSPDPSSCHRSAGECRPDQVAVTLTSARGIAFPNSSVNVNTIDPGVFDNSDSLDSGATVERPALTGPPYRKRQAHSAESACVPDST